MSLNHVVNLSQFSTADELGGRLEDVHFNNLLANEFYVDNVDVSGNILLGPTTEIKQNSSTITPTTFGYLSQINQNLATSASPTFTQVNANLNGQVTVGEQKSIISLPQLSIIQEQAVSPSAWQYVNTMNQGVSSTANVAFGTLESKAASATAVTIKTSGGTSIMVADTITPRVTFNTDVVVNGNITYNTITELKTTDPMIALADGNLTNTLDIGFYGTYSTSPPTPIYTGLFRDHTNSLWTFYDNLATEPTATVSSGYTLGSLKYGAAYLNDGTVGAPSVSWLNDSASGLYRIGANNYGYSIAGVKILDISASGLSSLTLLPVADNTYNLGSALLRYTNVYATTVTSTNLAGTLTTSAQPNITTLGGLTSIQSQSIASTAWQYVNVLNQSVSSSASPSFVSVTAALVGNVTGNVSGSSATVTSASQPNITTLANLTSIQSQSVASTAWQYVNVLNQSVSSVATPAFAGIVVNSYDLTTAARYLITINQDMGTSNSPSFVSVTAALVGNVTGNVSGSSATVTASAQPSITTLANLASVQGQALASSVWLYVAGMNQPVSSGASPSFANITSVGNVVTNSITTSAGALTVQPASGSGITTNLTGSEFKIVTSAGSTLFVGGGATPDLYINASGNVSLGTSSNPDARKLYVSGAIQSTGLLYSTGLSVNASASGSMASFLTGNTSNFGSISVGRAAAEAEFGIPAAAGNYFSNSAVGDLCLRITDSSKSVRVGAGSGAAILSVGSASAVMGGTLDLNSNNITNGGTITATTLAGTLSTTTQPNILAIGATNGININGFNSTGAYGCSISATNTAVSSNYQYGLVNSMQFNPSSDVSADIRVISSQPDIRAAGGITINRACGMYVYNYVGNNTGTISNAYGLLVDTGSSNTGTVTNAYGVYINQPSHGSQAVGLYVNGTSIYTNVASFTSDVYMTALPSSTQANLQINLATGQLSKPTSSMRYKTNIVESKVDTSLIYETVAKEFDYLPENSGIHDCGYIAEDLDAIGLGNLVNYDGLGRPDSIKYDKMCFYLLEELKKLKALNIALESRITSLENVPI